jgi:hypothetical protein
MKREQLPNLEINCEFEESLLSICIDNKGVHDC